jgi:hypothetical protein
MGKRNRGADPEKTRDQVEREDKEENRGTGDGMGEVMRKAMGAAMAEGTEEINREGLGR